MESIKISNRLIGENQPVFIIAEAGVNHNGDEDLAFKLIDEASSAGADAVKFQTFTAEESVSKKAPKADHHLANIYGDISHFDLLKRLELPFEVFGRLKSYAEKKGLVFLSTPYDIPSAKFLASIRIPALKIASSEVSNLPLVDTISELGLPVILSTGMNDLLDICEAVASLRKNDLPLALLKCTSNYPAAYENTNLRGMLTLKSKFPDCVVGFSDHTEGIEAACAAVALGACIIEKHFTTCKTLWGPDHKASMVPEEFSILVSAIRKVEEIMGDNKISTISAEESQKSTMQKSIYAKEDIPAGKIMKIDNLSFLRPASGIPAKKYKTIVGKKNKEFIPQHTMLKFEMFE
ncbi:MAG: N-acetylneuraminate synthase family protein [Candidatus Scalinduaceae bacterium]